MFCKEGVLSNDKQITFLLLFDLFNVSSDTDFVKAQFLPTWQLVK